MSIHSKTEKLQPSAIIAAKLSDLSTVLEPQVRKEPEIKGDDHTGALCGDALYWSWAAPDGATRVSPGPGRGGDALFWSWAGR